MSDYRDMREKLQQRFEYACGRNDVVGAALVAQVIINMDGAIGLSQVENTNSESDVLLINILDTSGSMIKDAFVQASKDAFCVNQQQFKDAFSTGAEQLFLQYYTKASWVTEKDFFSPDQTGGSLVSAAYAEVAKLINTYKGQNKKIFVHHISDGDNLFDNQDKAAQLLAEIFPQIDGLRYSQVGDKSNSDIKILLSPYVSSEKLKIEDYVAANKNNFFKKLSL